MPFAGKNIGCPEQIVGDRCAQHPGGVRPELPRRHVSERSVDEIGENGFDDGVPTVSDIGVDGVGEKWVIRHTRNNASRNRASLTRRTKSGGDRTLGGSENGVSGFGDRGIGNPGTGVGIANRESRIAPGYFTGVQESSAIESMARRTAVFLAITTENSTFARKHAVTTERVP